jgi:LacI family transcriptional regulator
MSKKGKIRIKDIAHLAGVSEGTVDRVLHNRGEVSDASRDAVEKVLRDMDYTPNILARSLASKKQYRFVCLIPAYNSGEYWQNIDDGFDRASEEFAHYNVNISKRYFNQYDPQSFLSVAEEILKDDIPEAVFIAPIFKTETLRFTDHLEKLDVPFSFIDSLVEDAPFVSYYGQRSEQSGYVAAKLLSGTLPPQSKVLIVRTKRKGESFSNQTTNRYLGFSQYLQEHNSTCQLIEVELDDDYASDHIILRRVFKQHPDIRSAITFNSKVFRLAKFLTDIHHQEVLLVGYDLLLENVTFLKQGVISYLIAQRPEKQAYFTVRDMCYQLIFQKEIQRINYVPIDILMKENIDYYVNFRD